MAKTADAKTRVYSKYGREIYVCAKNGGVDPHANLSLRGLLERAKKDQVPAHVIERALEKASGGGGEDFATARYEGFGPGSCMVIIECLTDNPNRTFGDVRGCFTKTGAKIGTPGSASHMFDHCAIFSFAGRDDEAVLEALVEADVDVTDIENEDGQLTIFAPHIEYAKARQALIDAFSELDFDTDDIQFVPQTTTPVEGENAQQLEKFLNMLNDLDDVQRVFHNAEIEESE